MIHCIKTTKIKCEKFFDFLPKFRDNFLPLIVYTARESKTRILVLGLESSGIPEMESVKSRRRSKIKPPKIINSIKRIWREEKMDLDYAIWPIYKWVNGP